EQLTGILKAAFEIITQDRSLRRLLAGGFAPFDDALHSMRDSDNRIQPDSVAPTPRRPIGPWLVPPRTPLSAPPVDATYAVHEIRADDFPQPQRPAVFPTLPDVIDSHTAARRLHKCSALQRRRPFQRCCQGYVRPRCQSTLSVKLGDLQPHRAGYGVGF